MDVLRFASLLLAGLLTGSELTSRLIVHPAPWRLPHDAQVKAEKIMYRRFASIDPFLIQPRSSRALPPPPPNTAGLPH